MNIVALPLTPSTPGTASPLPTPSVAFQDILNDCGTTIPQSAVAPTSEEAAAAPDEDARVAYCAAPRDQALFSQIETAERETDLSSDELLGCDPEQPAASPATAATQGVVALVLSRVAEANQPTTRSAAANSSSLQFSNGTRNSKSIANQGPAIAAREDLLSDLADPMADTGHDPIQRNSLFEIGLMIAPSPSTVSGNLRSDPTPQVEYIPLHLSQDGEWIGALSREVVGNAVRDNQLQFRLMPEHLGQLDVALTTDDGHVDIRLETSTAAAAHIIAADQARLVEDLRNAGLKLGQFEMTNGQNGNRQQQRQPAHDRQHTENNSIQPRTKASSRASGRFA